MDATAWKIEKEMENNIKSLNEEGFVEEELMEVVQDHALALAFLKL